MTPTHGRRPSAAALTEVVGLGPRVHLLLQALGERLQLQLCRGRPRLLLRKEGLAGQLDLGRAGALLVPAVGMEAAHALLERWFWCIRSQWPVRRCRVRGAQLGAAVGPVVVAVGYEVASGAGVGASMLVVHAGSGAGWKGPLAALVPQLAAVRSRPIRTGPGTAGLSEG